MVQEEEGDEQRWRNGVGGGGEMKPLIFSLLASELSGEGEKRRRRHRSGLIKGILRGGGRWHGI